MNDALAELSHELKEQALRQGFSLAGICPAVSPPSWGYFQGWLQAGHAGEMAYLADRAAAYAHPRAVLEGARSILMLALDYRTVEPAPAGQGQGRISRYAWGRDYHDVIRRGLAALAQWLKARRPEASVRGVVDTAPLLEREFAQLAGLGWIGKNTMLLNQQRGSWFFLAALLTDLELEYDAPYTLDHCGTCRACLDACPTGALPAPYVLDARKCISYLTIELRTAIPLELRAGLGDWVFGCDVCQEVCPWNRKAPESNEEGFMPLSWANPVALAELFTLDEAAFRAMFRPTPLWRAKRRGLLRNAAIVLGNQRCEAALPALVSALQDKEPLVRGAAAWALGQLATPAAREALLRRREVEEEPDVQHEVNAALGGNSA